MADILLATFSNMLFDRSLLYVDAKFIPAGQMVN